MKTIFFFRSLILCISLLWVCALPVCAQKNKITASQTYITKTVNTDTFDAIHSIGSVDVSYTQNKENNTSVEIYGSDNLVDLVDIKVENKILQIKFKKDISILFKEQGRLKVMVSNPSINSIKLDGAGDIYLENDIRAREFQLNLTGSGDIKALGNIIVETSFFANLSGSGDIEIKGNIETNVCKISLKGSGDIKTHSLTATTGAVQLQGSGDIDMQKNRADQLTVNLSGSGDIDMEGIESQKVAALLKGSGQIELQGKAEVTTLEVKNSGSIKAEQLKTQFVAAKTNGSGSIHCNPTDRLNAEIYGSGNILYKGEPKIQQSISGSGKVRKM